MMTQKIENYIRELLEKAGFIVDSIDSNVSETGTYICKISSPDSQDLIGKDGETLQALNHLLKRAFGKETEDGSHLMLDINDYQEKNIQKIKTVAHTMAERSRFFKSSIELDPMNAFERHIIHEYIQNQEDLETESTGFGKDRRVVIKFKK